MLMMGRAYVRRNVAYFSALLVLLLLTSSIAYEPKSLWTYFTNWNLAIQYCALVSALDDPTKRIILLDLASLIAWTVAVSYSVVVGISVSTLKTMHKLYGIVPFWIGNSLLHYIPPFLFSASIRTEVNSFESRFLSLVTLLILIGLYTVWHDTHDVYLTDVLERYEGMGYMMLAAVGLTPLVLDFGYINTFYFIWPEKNKDSNEKIAYSFLPINY